MILRLSRIPVWIVSILLLITGCKSTRPATTSVPTLSKDRVLAEMDSNRLSFNHFNAKARVEYKDENSSYQFTLQMRMEMGTKIWFQANFLGFEVARILLNSDSVYFLNRMEKTCYQSTLKGISKIENIEVDLVTIQNLIIGNPLFSSQQDLKVSFGKNHVRFTHNNDIGKIIYLVDPVEFTLSHLQIQDISNEHVINASFKDYKLLGNSGPFSYFREYITKNNNAYISNIQVIFTNIDISEAKDMPFDIPDDYTISPL